MKVYEVAELGFDTSQAVDFLCREGRLSPGALLVMGCSTSEIGGGRIGKSGSPEVGETVVRGAMVACDNNGVVLAVQCCEHLNRALVMPRAEAVRRGCTVVSAVPYPDAGGSAASAYYRLLGDPVLVEAVSADAGLDIGQTLIGMHLRPVAVPLRPEKARIGEAVLTMAYARPKLIGGGRARYTLP